MTRQQPVRASRGASWRTTGTRGWRVGSAIAATMLILAVVASPVVLQAARDTAAAAAAASAGAPNGTPLRLKEGAATLLETVVAPGGAGYTFEIVQRSTIKARPNGPKIEIPDPLDPHKSLGAADEYFLIALIERGAVTPDGFWMEMRSGPAKDAEPDWGAAYQYGAIAKGDAIWRDDGNGWYETDSPPGIGLDPRTAALLPRLLRNAAGAADAGTKLVKGKEARKITASAAKADVPGVIAVDGETFTKLRGPAELAFDNDGRLVEIRIIALNTNMTQFDLEVETVITLGYPLMAEPLPEPKPVLTDTAPVILP